MPLPTSGAISLSQIRAELGVPSQAPFSLNTATNGGYATVNTCSNNYPISTDPDSVSEWLGYCHSCTCGYYFCMGFSTASCATACSNYDPVNGCYSNYQF
jgi:hypothetical protein